MEKKIHDMTRSEVDQEIHRLCQRAWGVRAHAVAVLVDRRNVYSRTLASGGIPDPVFASDLLGAPGEMDLAILAALQVLSREPDNESSLAVVNLAAAYYEMALYGPRREPSEPHEA